MKQEKAVKKKAGKSVSEAKSGFCTDFPVSEFILRNYKNFNARVTRDALLAYWQHIERGGKMFWAVAGAMSS
ncbi:MAG TPA: hypothetical protein PKH07_19560, partial [bacterium]|nr:hypothetical protein [bacterium]